MADPVFLLLSEDGGADRVPIWSALLKRSFVFAEDCTQTQRLRFRPEDEPQFRRALSANLWKGSRKHQIDLAQMIARHLAQGPRFFVLLHVDGDQTWAKAQESENRQKLDTLLLPKVDQELKRLTAEAAEGHRRRLLLAVPFYSIEAWLYQNLAMAREIAQTHPARATLLAQITAWEADRASLDAILRPKEVCPLHDAHNRALAERSWPAEAAYGADASYKACLDDWLRCEDLVVALKGTAAPPNASAASPGP